MRMKSRVERRRGGGWARGWGAVAMGVAVLVGTPTGASGQGAKANAAALEEAERLNGEAVRLYGEGKFDAGISFAERALLIREKALGPEDPEVASSLNNLAFLYDSKGDYTKAESLHQRALLIREKVLGPGHPDLATSLDGLASLYKTKGDYAKAEPLYERALSIRENALATESTEVGISLNNLAVLYYMRGAYAKAEPLYKRLLASQVKALGMEDPVVANTLNNFAFLYDSKGDYGKAEPLYKLALSIREKALGPEHPDVAVSLNNLAALYTTKRDYDKAEPLYERALSIQEKALEPEHPDLAASLNNLAFLYDSKGDYAKVEALYQRALLIFEKAHGPDHPDVATALTNLATLYKTKGNYGKAEPLYERALLIREKALGPEHPEVEVSLTNIAGFFLARGDVAAAVRMRERAAAIAGRNAAAELTGSDEQRGAYMMTLQGKTHIDVSLHVQFAPGVKEARKLALTTILNRKGRVLDAMADGVASLRRRLAPAAQQKVDAWRSASSKYSAFALRGPGTMALADYRKTLADLDRKRQKLESELMPQSADLKAALLPVTVEQVQTSIPAGAALVEVFKYAPFNPRAATFEDTWGKPRYVAYVLRRSGDITWADLGEAAAIDKGVDQLLPVLGRPGGDHRPAARALDALVMQPIRRLLGDTREIFLSPDDALNLVPFAALIDEDGSYLVERYALTYVASGRDLMRLQATSSSRPQNPPVVIAAPAFNAVSRPAPVTAQEARGERSADMGTRSYGPLPYAAEEGRAVHQKLQETTLLTGVDATESAVKALRGPRVLHIATHGFFLPDKPELRARALGEVSAGLQASRAPARPAPFAENPLLRSGLVFAGVNNGQSGADDGVLTALEASQLDLGGTKLVVLSACESGVGKARSGDGVYGLRRALVMAGAETQVMSLWKVNDASTREQMEAYYDALLKGGGRSEAMRQVQLAMLARAERAHPYYWASFIVSGNPAALDGKPVVPRVDPGPRGCACELGASSLPNTAPWPAILAILALARRRRRDPSTPSTPPAESR